MKALAAPAISTERVTALLVVAALVLAPGLWIAWSLYASSVVAGTVRSQSAALAGLRGRLTALSSGTASADALNAASVFLPGETPAIAGAALQRLVADTIAAAGGRVLESEFAPVEAAAEDPGRVDLRVSFETEIVGLQQILFALETGLPALTVRGLDVQSPAAAEAAAATDSPPLRVDLLAGGYWEAPQ